MAFPTFNETIPFSEVNQKADAAVSQSADVFIELQRMRFDEQRGFSELKDAITSKVKEPAILSETVRSQPDARLGARLSAIASFLGLVVATAVVVLEKDLRDDRVGARATLDGLESTAEKAKKDIADTSEKVGVVEKKQDVRYQAAYLALQRTFRCHPGRQRGMQLGSI